MTKALEELGSGSPGLLMSPKRDIVPICGHWNPFSWNTMLQETEEPPSLVYTQWGMRSEFCLRGKDRGYWQNFTHLISHSGFTSNGVLKPAMNHSRQILNSTGIRHWKAMPPFRKFEQSQ